MEKVYATSGAFGAIVTPTNDSEAFVRAGMLFERVWLTTTKLGLSLQATTGLHFFAQPILEGSSFDLSENTTDFIKERYAVLRNTFWVGEGDTVALVFRIRYADAPSAVTTRFEPKVTFQEQNYL